MSNYESKSMWDMEIEKAMQSSLDHLHELNKIKPEDMCSTELHNKKVVVETLHYLYHMKSAAAK